ncbi:hypothetical membrane spanning protein [Mycoplasmopsis fermentans JER]|nr:hypothetical membrane spanning protein [Mycoplasmopsis fermentans JER]
MSPFLKYYFNFPIFLKNKFLFLLLSQFLFCFPYNTLSIPVEFQGFSAFNFSYISKADKYPKISLGRLFISFCTFRISSSIISSKLVFFLKKSSN